MSLIQSGAKFGNFLYLTEVINRSKFGVDWYGSFGSGEVQNVPFPTGKTSAPYHCSANVFARDTSVNMIYYENYTSTIYAGQLFVGE